MNSIPNMGQCLTYLETQLGPQAKRRSITRSPTVTLSRMTGSGGLAIADRLAEILEQRRPAAPASWTVFDRSLIEKALAEDKLPANFFRFVPENRVSYIRDTLEELFGLHPAASTLVTRISQTILHLGELGNCVIVGRGSHVVLAKCDTALHVRLIGSLDCRVQRIVETKKISASAARDIVTTDDAARRRYLKTYLDADIDDPLKYHLVINTDTFTIDAVADLIADAVLARFPKV